MTLVCLLILLLTRTIPASASPGSTGSEAPDPPPPCGHELDKRLGEVTTKLENIGKDLAEMKENIEETKQTIGELRQNTTEIKTESKSINKSIESQESAVKEIRNQLWQLVVGMLLTFLAIIGTAFFPRKRNR